MLVSCVYLFLSLFIVFLLSYLVITNDLEKMTGLFSVMIKYSLRGKILVEVTLLRKFYINVTYVFLIIALLVHKPLLSQF